MGASEAGPDQIPDRVHSENLCIRAIAILWLWIAVLGLARALEPGRPTSEFLRTVFTTEDGLPDNEVNAIVQTQNGFLWVGTDGGLARFDGHHFTTIHLHGHVSNEIPVLSLLEEPHGDGDLWVGTDAGLAQITKAALDYFNPSLVKTYHFGIGQSDQIMCLYMSRAGVLWIGTNRGLFFRNRGRFVAVMTETNISRIDESSDGHLFFVTGRGVMEWNGNRLVEHPEFARQLDISKNDIYHIFDDSHGVRWFCTKRGLARIVHGSLERITPVSSRSSDNATYRIHEDLQGNEWVNTKLGLYRVAANRLESMTPDHPVHARSLYSDREGNLWVGTAADGLIRFKDRAVRMYTTADGLPSSNIVMTVLADHAGTIWTGSNCGGLSRLDGEHFRTYAEADGLKNSCVWTLAEDDHHDLWIGTWGGGVFQFHNGHFTEYSTPQGLPSNVALSIVAARDGSIWIATLVGVSHIQNGHFRNYTTDDGLSSDRILTVYQDHRGEIWVGTDNGIDHLVGDRFVLVQSERHSDHVPYSSLREDALGDLYVLSSVDGINRIENDRLVNIWRGIQPLGMLESSQHTFWFSGNRGVFRIVASELQRAEHDRDSPLDYAAFGRADGLNTPECSEGQSNMAMTPDGKLWIATTKGLAMIDLKRVFGARRMPNIFVGTVSIDGKSRFAGPTLSLEPGSHHLEFHFDVVDLSSPEKVRLQYRMDGVDLNWLDADSTRTAIYTSIPFGNHSFHIRATDSNGVWDRTGITYLVTQQPFFYQTIWFRFLVLMSLVLLLVSIYLLRVRYIVGQVRSRLEERMSERERIARELHDTLLQGFQGLILRFHAASRQMPSSEPTRKILETALERADEVLIEARDRVSDLRVEPDLSIDLSQALAQAGKELIQEHNVDFNVAVEGDRQSLHPIIRYEVFQIGKEALVNAFRHAQAKHIEIEIAYSRDEIRFRLRDDGRGIDKEVLEADGRQGHWGIRGMRERAQRIGAHLTIWSRPSAGTEVELRVPASIAYRNNTDGALWQRLLQAAGWRAN